MSFNNYIVTPLLLLFAYTSIFSNKVDENLELPVIVADSINSQGVDVLVRNNLSSSDCMGLSYKKVGSNLNVYAQGLLYRVVEKVDLIVPICFHSQDCFSHLEVTTLLGEHMYFMDGTCVHSK